MSTPVQSDFPLVCQMTYQVAKKGSLGVIKSNSAFMCTVKTPEGLCGLIMDSFGEILDHMKEYHNFEMENGLTYCGSCRSTFAHPLKGMIHYLNHLMRFRNLDDIPSAQKETINEALNSLEPLRKSLLQKVQSPPEVLKKMKEEAADCLKDSVEEFEQELLQRGMLFGRNF